MKKTLAFVLTAVMSLSLLAGCGSKTTAPDNTNNDQPQQAALSGSVSTNGSTSMEKVIGALSEQFMADNSGVSVYDNVSDKVFFRVAPDGDRVSKGKAILQTLYDDLGRRNSPKARK